MSVAQLVWRRCSRQGYGHDSARRRAVIRLLLIVALGFATIGLGFAELELLSAFAATLTVVDVVVGGEVRGTLPGVRAVLGFAKLMLGGTTSNPGFTEVGTFVSLFPPGVFVGGS